MKYEKWFLGYWALKQYIRFVDWTINNKTILIGKDKIPKNKPVLFAPNHQNALSDPMAVLLNTKFQPVWLARGQYFILNYFRKTEYNHFLKTKENLFQNLDRLIFA